MTSYKFLKLLNIFKSTIKVTNIKLEFINIWINDLFYLHLQPVKILANSFTSKNSFNLRKTKSVRQTLIL